MMARGLPPGLARVGGEGFAFTHWRAHRQAAFERLVEDLEDAAEDAGTTYFPASYDAAHAATHATLAAFEALVASLPPDAASKVRRGSGLKMEQLKAELAALEPH